MAEGGGVPQLGGYHYEFVDEVPDKLKCPVCLLTLKDPMQIAKCGHRFCQLCIDRILSNSQSRCPVDLQRISEVKVFEDTACKRDILELHVYCPSEGCRWSGELRDVELHEDKCLFKLLPCENEGCVEQVMRSRHLQHMTMSCEWREVRCIYCNETYTWVRSKEHRSKCSYYPLPCVNRCGEDGIPRDEMTAHVTNVCPAAVIPCKYEHVGCEVKVRRDALPHHIKESMEEHLDLACAKLRQLEDRVKEINTRERKLDSVCDKLKQLEAHTKAFVSRKPDWDLTELLGIGSLVWKIEAFDKHLEEIRELFSDPFYTSPQGYKMRLKLDPGGEDGEYVGVFLQIMKGKYDNMLTWPFHYTTVTFTLIDQQENGELRENYSAHFTYDPDDYSKPVGNEGASWGLPTFMSHGKLATRRYMVDNTIFLKVQVEVPQKSP